MLISRVEDGKGGCEAAGDARDDALDYQAASELFDLMTKNHPCDYNANDSLSASDLVFLYKNIELGTNMMNETNNIRRRPNQLVETIVYNDDQDSEDSDPYDISSEEVHNLFAVNEERLDLISNPSSLGNTLCPKLGNLQLQNSSMSTQYDKYFLFKDPYIKEQLNSLNFKNASTNDLAESVLPSSLLDYICCKRLEDNHNFYMDNIIRYVNHTIEHLKRISNGDFLTERAKEKWRQVENIPQDTEENATKDLAMSTSIPLQVEHKASTLCKTFDDSIHSEVDVRSLSKILEKKIVIEIPKQICGTYKLFSKLCSESLIISCKKDEAIAVESKEASRVDVVVPIERLDTGQVISNINSIVILKSAPQIQQDISNALPLPSEEEECNGQLQAKIIEVDDDENEIQNDVGNYCIKTFDSDRDESLQNTLTEKRYNYNDSESNSIMESYDSSNLLGSVSDIEKSENLVAYFKFPSPDDLSLSMHKLNLSCLTEEKDDETLNNAVSKKKSPTKIRVKSPYENKSLVLEEKKRRRLLEIRERREKKKKTLSENCKITKHKFGKGAISPQTTNSVTKLSITNKSFYNSIYGNNACNNDDNSSKSKIRKPKRELSSVLLNQLDGEEDVIVTPEKNPIKYVNRSYYLDDAVTEMMYTELKHSDCGSDVRELFSTSASGVSNDSNNMTGDSLVSDLKVDIRVSCKNLDNSNETRFGVKSLEINCVGKEESPADLTVSRSTVNVVPTNTPCHDDARKREVIKKLAPVECRQSIDKIYGLMKKLSNSVTDINDELRNTSVNVIDTPPGPVSSTVQCSDSGTSIKHHLTSSNPSSFSLEKVQIPKILTFEKNMVTKAASAMINVEPKVVISTKQITKAEIDNTKRDRKKTRTLKFSDNPLKAISQLLHDIDNVQQNRQKSESKPKKPEDLFEGRGLRPGSLKKRLKTDQSKEERQPDKNVKFLMPKERRARPTSEFSNIRRSKIPQTVIEDRNASRVSGKNITDILDEVKEAKGEAVRGPSKFNSRLNSLAQPKKSYVQAHSEEYQTKYGRNMMADRLQRLAALPGRQRRQEAPAERPTAPPLPSIGHGARGRRSSSGSPVGNRTARDAPSCKQCHVSDAPTELKNKMEAVESYVKSHYGREKSRASGSPRASPNRRAPLVPRDFETYSCPSPVSGEESNILGNKLHRLIDNMINFKQDDSSALKILNMDCKNTADADVVDTISQEENLFKYEEPSSVNSDFPTDLFQDKHVKTAVETFQNDHDSVTHKITLKKLEHALDRRLSLGAYQKSLRIKKVTLSPKRSMEQTLLLQASDTGSIVLQSTASNSLKLSSSEDLESLKSLTKHQLAWNFTGIPLQDITVGYTFPEFQIRRCTAEIKTLHDIFDNDGTASSNPCTQERVQQVEEQNEKLLKVKTQDVQANAVFSDINSANLGAVKTAPQPNKMVTTSVATDFLFCDSREQTCGDRVDLATAYNNSGNKQEPSFKDQVDTVDCTSSLDMLVGLLNEIQKITTGHMSTACLDDPECKPIENLFTKNALSGEKNNEHHSHEIISLASLENLRQLESCPSLLSLYVSNDEKDRNCADVPRVKIIGIDKEVGAEVFISQYIDTCTDAPSSFFSATTCSHSTSVTNSMLQIFREPPSQTIITYNGRKAVCATPVLVESRKKNIEISKYSADGQNIVTTTNTPRYIETKNIQKKDIKKMQKETLELNVYRAKEELFQGRYNIQGSKSDPLLKVKRDILVTIYSMLVFTVFAALSFPEILNHFQV